MLFIKSIKIHFNDKEKRWEDGILYGTDKESYARTVEDFIKSFSRLLDTPNLKIIKEYPDGIATSFHNCTIRTSINKLTEILGDSLGPSCDNKATNQWYAYYNDDIFFTIYDWKEYREIGNDELIDWHIGSKNKEQSELVKEYLNKLIN